MFVIDGVELTTLQKTKQVGELQSDQPGILHQRPQTCGEVPDVGNVREDIVATTRSALP